MKRKKEKQKVSEERGIQLLSFFLSSLFDYSSSFYPSIFGVVKNEASKNESENQNEKIHHSFLRLSFILFFNSLSLCFLSHVSLSERNLFLFLLFTSSTVSLVSSLVIILYPKIFFLRMEPHSFSLFLSVFFSFSLQKFSHFLQRTSTSTSW